MRNPEKETELGKLPGVILLALDVTNPAQVKEIVGKAIALGPIDVVFNNAGYGMAGPLEAFSEEQILRMVNTNMLGTIRITKAFCSFLPRT